LADRARLRIFISSPGDVSAAREVVAQTIEQAALEFRRHVVVEPYLWENEAMLASGAFQDSIDPPSEFDIVVLILGARLGTPLPARTEVREYRGIDGRVPVTGTEWEFEDALAAARAGGAPDLLVYRSRQDIAISSMDIGVQQQQLKQLDALNAFWSKHFADRGSFIGAYSEFETLESLALAVERDLRSLITKRVRASAEQAPGSAPVLWLREPFRGLESYEYEHAPIYFGRGEAVGRAMLQLIAQATAGVAFLVVLGASGSGKSSLVKAGVAPKLFEPRRVPSAAFLRRVVFQPGEAAPDRDVFEALAHTLIRDGAGLPELLGPSMVASDLAAHFREAGDPGFLFRRALDEVAADARRNGEMLNYQQPQLLLIVDQLEELFTSNQISADQRTRFVALLGALAASRCVFVVATMRSDLWHRAAETPELIRLAAGEGRLDLVAASPAEISQMIRMPALSAGIGFETDPDTGIPLDDRIAEEAASEPGALPLLSYLLETLYQGDAAGGRLTYASFNAVGRLRGAIAARADETLAGLPPDARAALARVVFQLVQLTGDDQDVDKPVARRARLAAFAPAGPERALIDAFVTARLLVVDGVDGDASVRIAHEALIGEWSAARDLVARQAEAMNTRRTIEQRMRRARSRDHTDPSEAQWLAGPDLSDALALQREFAELIGSELTDFIDRSAAHARRSRSRSRARLAAVAGALAVLLIATGAALIIARGYHRAAVAESIDRTLLRQEGQARYAYAQGDFVAAAAGFRSDESLARQLVAMQPANTQWRYNLAASEAYAAYSLQKEGQADAAAREYANAVTDLAALAKVDVSGPTVADRESLQGVLAASPVSGSSSTRPTAHR
jgi:hypothetical protein